MPKWVKITLIVVLLVFAGVIAAVIVAARWVKSQARSLEADGRIVRAEAEAFARGKDAEACVAESLRRVRACSEFTCQVKAKAFARVCLENAEVPDAFCASVPAPTDFLAVGQWQVDQCTRRGFAADRRCIGIIGEIPLYCSQNR